jgi:hypothetical protein
LTLAEISKVDGNAFGGYKPKTIMDLEAICDRNDMNDVVELWKLGVEKLKENAIAIAELIKRISFIRQMQYSDDPKRVFNWLIRDKTPMCEIDPDILHTFFDDRWKKGEYLADNLDFRLQNTMSESMKKKFIDELLDVDKMNTLIRTRGNISAPGLDGLTNPIIKIERKTTTEAMLEVMQTLVNSGN